MLFAKNKVRGIFTDDPQKNPDAQFYQQMHYNTIIQNNLTVADQSSILLSRDHALPIHVFDFAEQGTMQRICSGEDLGTLVSNVDEDVLE